MMLRLKSKPWGLKDFKLGDNAIIRSVFLSDFSDHYKGKGLEESRSGSKENK